MTATERIALALPSGKALSMFATSLLPPRLVDLDGRRIFSDLDLQFPP